MKKIFCLGLLVLGLGQTRSAAAIDLSLVATMNFASPSVQNTGNVQATASNPAFGFGGLIAFPFMGGLNLETGVLLVSHSYNSAGFRTNVNGLTVPALLRFTGLPVLSIAAGPYISFPTGSYSSTDLSNNTTTTGPVTGSHLPSTDFGLAFSAAADFAINTSTAVTIDLRYYFGLVNVDSAILNSHKYGGLLFLGGVKLSL